MKKLLMTGLLFFVTKFIQGTVSSVQDLTQSKLAILYVHSIKISRLFFISLVGAGACLIFLLIGLILVHQTILSYAPWEASVKVTITLICAVSYLLIAAGIFFYVFAEDKWMKMFN